MKHSYFILKRSVIFGMLLAMTVCTNTTFGQFFSADILGVQQIVDEAADPPELQGLNIVLLYDNPPGGQPQFLNIYAQVPGTNNVAWVVMNMYLDVFPSPRELNRSFALSQIGLPDNEPVPAINLYMEHSEIPATEPGINMNFTTYDCIPEPYYIVCDDSDDPPGVGSGPDYTPMDYIGVVQAGLTRGCDVPNVDLDNSNHPSSGTYAGDLNACGPASVANSLSWIQSKNANVGTDGLTERQRLEELSRLMGRSKYGGVTPEQIIQGKISFIANHGLKLRVEYKHTSGNYAEDVKWMQDQYNAGQDIEFDYSFPQNGKTKRHAVVLTGLTITGNVPQIAFKDDSKQRKAGGTSETSTNVSEGADGRPTFVRNGVTCTINNMYAESYDANAGTYTDPGTGTTSTKFCAKGESKFCSGACPPLVSFYYKNKSPVVSYPACESKKCCNIKILYAAASGACTSKKNKCRGSCAEIYKSKQDAEKGANPIQGKCVDLGGCKCKYKVDKKYRSPEDFSEEIAEGDKLRIYPNPATQRIHIDVAEYEGNYQLQLISMLGRQLVNQSIKLNFEEVYPLDISNIPPGIYIVLLKNEEGVSGGTFVKQ